METVAEYRKLLRLWESQAEWSRATFGADSRGPVGALAHLAEEVEEARVMWKAVDIAPQVPIVREHYVEELADCFILLMEAARLSGLGLGDLVEAARVKHEENRGRTWAKAESAGVFHHVKGSEEKGVGIRVGARVRVYGVPFDPGTYQGVATVLERGNARFDSEECGVKFERWCVRFDGGAQVEARSISVRDLVESGEKGVGDVGSI